MTTSTNQQGEPRFEWDFDVPDTPFWKGIDFRVARNFLTCLDSSELEDVPFDQLDGIDAKNRLLFLLSQLQARLSNHEVAAAPSPLYIADPDQWRKFMLAIQTLQNHLDLPQDEAKTIRRVLHTAEGDSRIPWLNMLANLDLKNGDYAEAEELALEVVPWMQAHAKLGVDSPQALGSMRTLIQAAWHQGGAKREEAKRLIRETSDLIEDMGSSKFAKYQEEERQMLQKLKEELE